MDEPKTTPDDSRELESIEALFKSSKSLVEVQIRQALEWRERLAKTQRVIDAFLKEVGHLPQSPPPWPIIRNPLTGFPDPVSPTADEARPDPFTGQIRRVVYGSEAKTPEGDAMAHFNSLFPRSPRAG